MATIIQNLACFELSVDTKSKRVYLNEDLLQGKEIDRLFLYAGNEDRSIISPLAPAYLSEEFYISSLGNISQLGLYANLFTPEGKQFMNNFFVENVLIDTESVFIPNRTTCLELPVGRVLDTQKSYLTTYMTGAQEDEVMKLLVYVSYKTQPEKLTDNKVTGSYTIEIPIPGGDELIDFKLSDFVDFSLRKLPVKKISVSASGGDIVPAYLYLKGKNTFIENMPLDLLALHGVKEFFFDNLQIDFEQSYFKLRGVTYGIEKQRITFIY